MTEYVECLIPRDVAEALAAETEVYAVRLEWLDDGRVELVCTRDLDLATSPEASR